MKQSTRQRQKPKGYKQISLSTKAPTDGVILNEVKQEASRIKSLFQKTILDDFINSIEDKNVDEGLYLEFFDAIKGKQQNYIDELIRSINIAETKYNLVKVAVSYFELNDLLGRDWRKDVEVIRAIGKHVRIGAKDSLQTVLTRAARYITDIEEKRAELALLDKSGEKGVIADSEYFTFMIVQISKYMKFHINRKQTYVAEFAEMIIELRKENERIEQQIKKDAITRPHR